MKHVYAKCWVFVLLFLVSGQLMAQHITGFVYDENKDPLPGVAVKIRGTQIGMATDIDGRFSLRNLRPGTVIVELSFIGFKTVTQAVEVKPNETANLVINMVPDVSELEEIVIVGYGVQRRREVTGSIVSLSTRDITDIPAPSFENAIQGKAAGVQVITGSGLAGSGSVVRVRGIASISAGGDPLYVVDGIPITQDYFLNGNRGGMNNNPLATINPNDIESIEILKDASATGIYGSRGANGVILITTKRGKKKGTQYNFESRVGWSTPTARPNMMNGPQFLQMFEEAWINDGFVGVPRLPGGISWEDAQNYNTNWVDEVIGIGMKQKYDFSVSKGGNKYRLFAAGSWQDDGSYLIGNSYQRLAGRLNFDYKLAKNLDFNATMSWSRGQNNRVDAAWSGGLGAAMSTALPIYPIRWMRDNVDDNGNIINREGDYFLGAGIWNNPVAQRDLKRWRALERRTISGVGLTWRPIDNLIVRANASYDYMDFNDDIYEAPGYDPNFNFGRAFRYPFYSNNYNGNLTATYFYNPRENHAFTFLVGTEAQKATTHRYDAIIIDTAVAPFFENREQEVTNNPVFSTTEWAFASAFARMNYAFKRKYLLEATFRTDGSSRFGSNNRFGFFPSASAGWILSDEEFLKDNRVISFLKLKSSYGINGNANIPDYQRWGTFSRRGNGYNGQEFIFPTRLANPDLRWETVRTIDVSLEFGLFKDRITGEIAFYDKYAKDVLLDVAVQQSSGFSNYWDNVGEILNRGAEFSIRSRNLVGKFRWTTDFNIARNYNEIVSIGPYTEDAVSGGTNDTRVVVGMPVGTNFLVRHAGVDPATGRPIYLDVNGNQTFDWDPINRVPVGSVLPDAIGGITNTFQYGPWELSMMFVFTIGGDIFDSSSKRQLGTFDSDGWNHRTEHFDRWRQPGDIATYPRLTTMPINHGSGTPWINTDLWLHDGTYARLRNLTIGYTIPREKLERYKIEGARIYATGVNLLTFTRFIGLDPEIARDFENPTDRNMSPNITYLTPPQERMYTFGISLTF
jgi:TonB-linked SusC/RagA family outer membrane protein